MLQKTITLFLCLCILLSILLPVAAVPSETEHRMNPQELEMLRVVNRERLTVGSPPLTSLPVLQEGCGIRAAELAESFSHTRPDGRAWYSILQDIGAISMKKAAENLAGGYAVPADAVQGWMLSDGHRRNLLDPELVHLGNGYCRIEGSYYEHYWAQLFYTTHRCEYLSMKLELPSGEPVEPGTSIDQMGLIALLECKSCGTSYLPVLREYCSGYDPNRLGTQEVTLSCLGQSLRFSLSVGEESNPLPPSTPGFSDLDPKGWYMSSIEFMVSQGLMNGVGNGKFDPEGSVTRAMMVTILYRSAGSPSVKGMKNPFKDVPITWYTDAVIWAANNGVVNGVDKNHFAPEASITREQIATILYRYEGSPDAADTLPPFADNRSISGYALKPMNWAIDKGLINGVGGGFLAPADTATRAQIATILARYLNA